MNTKSVFVTIAILRDHSIYTGKAFALTYLHGTTVTIKMEIILATAALDCPNIQSETWYFSKTYDINMPDGRTKEELVNQKPVAELSQNSSFLDPSLAACVTPPRDCLHLEDTLQLFQLWVLEKRCSY